MKSFFDNHRRLCGYLMVLICFILVGLFTEGGGDQYGVWSVLPPVMLFVFCLMTRSIIEGFLWGGMLAAFMIHRGGFFTGWLDGLSDTIADPDNVYLILIFLFIGIFVAFLKMSGAAGYFANWLGSKTKNPKILLLIDWILGIALSVDEYMAGFTIGAAMTPVNDEQRIPREATAYVIRSVNVNPACMNPLNAWAIFIATTLESIGFAAEGQGMSEYIHVIPFLFFNMAAMLVSFLFIMGWLPKLGGIKKAYGRVAAGGSVAPETARDVEDGEELVIQKGVNLLSFILPILALVAFAFIFEFNMVYAIMAAIVVEIVLYLIQGIIKVDQMVELALRGISDMTELTVFLVVGMVMSGLVSQTGFTDFIVNSLADLITPWVLPVLVFAAFSFTEFLVTFNWTLYLMAMPAVIGLAQATGTNVYLAIAALVCAGVWGSSASFSADNAIVVCSSCKLDVYTQNMSQLVYLIITELLAIAAFLVAGIIMA